jgi:hypothetical protein
VGFISHPWVHPAPENSPSNVVSAQPITNHP